MAEDGFENPIVVPSQVINEKKQSDDKRGAKQTD